MGARRARDHPHPPPCTPKLQGRASGAAAPSARVQAVPAQHHSGPASQCRGAGRAEFRKKALSPHPRGQESPCPGGELPPAAQWGARPSPGVPRPPQMRGEPEVPLLPPNADYKSQQASRHGEPGQGHPVRGQGWIPAGPPSPPRSWREAVGRAGERTLTETLFSHPKNSSWPFPQLPSLANALPLDEKKNCSHLPSEKERLRVSREAHARRK